MIPLTLKNYQNFKIFFTFILFWLSIQFGSLFEDIVAFSLIITVGVLHGANDILILQKKGNKDRLKQLSIYVGIILLTVAAYFISQMIALLLFVLISAYHFGEEHFENKFALERGLQNAIYIIYGLVIFGGLFYFSLDEVNSILLNLGNFTISKQIIEIFFFGSSLFLLLILSLLTYLKKISLKEVIPEFFYVLLLLVIFGSTTLIYGFAVYFILWHSIPSILGQIEFLSNNFSVKSFKFYFKKAAFFWGISLVFLFSLYKLIPRVEDFTTAIFVILFAVTTPHIWVMYKMKN